MTLEIKSIMTDLTNKNSKNLPQFRQVPDKEELIRLRILRIESHYQKAYETATWQFQRSWGRLTKMLYHAIVSSLCRVALFPVKIYCKNRGLSVRSVIR